MKEQIVSTQLQLRNSNQWLRYSGNRNPNHWLGYSASTSQHSITRDQEIRHIVAEIYAQQYALCLPDKALLQQKLREWIAEYKEKEGKE